MVAHQIIPKGDTTVDEAMNQFLRGMEQEAERKAQTMERLLSAADAAKVFSQPVTSGGYTVITAAEVGGGGGFGSGMGMGAPRGRRRRDAGQDEQAADQEERGTGAGIGGGGGGGSMGRPVSTIIIGPDGVEVRPVLDVTKLTLAALTAFGTVGALALKVLKARR
jgi:uncharacterized spore protein YtfJ